VTRRGAWDSQWDTGFAELVAYKTRWGHVDGPFRVHYPRLANWVTKQRRHFRQGKLSPERTRRLEAIGLSWDGDRGKRGLGGSLAAVRSKRRRNSDAGMLQRLRRFVAERGHCYVKPSDDEGLQRWLTESRRRDLPGSLTASLRQLGAPLTAEEVVWEKRFATVAQRVKQGKGFTAGHPTQIGPWMDEQRRLAAQGRLTRARAARLRAIGFFDPARQPVKKSVLRNQRRFEAWLSKLEQWKRWRARASVHAARPRHLKEWIGDQLKASRLEPRRKQLLAEAGFPLERGVLDARWQARLELLRRFVERHGHTRVPRTTPQIGGWTQKQRTEHAKGRLLPHRKAALDALGFDWVPAETTWQVMLQRLTAFHARHGHANVSRHDREDPELGRWLHMVRRQARLGELSDAERKVAQLTALGVAWDGASIRRQRAFDYLEAFWHEHGHCDPKQAKDATAYSHAYRFRRDRARGELPDEWMRRLDALGFIWESRLLRRGTRDGRWPELLAFFRAHGHCLVPDVGKTRELHAWAEELREQHRRGELDEKLARRLKEIAFPLDAAAVAWERSFARLVTLVPRGGRLPPVSHPLGRWARGQLTLAQVGLLSPEQADRLRPFEELR